MKEKQGLTNNTKVGLISVIIPAYKAENYIGKNLKQVNKVLGQTRYSYEIICVVDGKVDRTYQEAKKVAKK